MSALPSGWRIVRLDSVAVVRYGKAKPKGLGTVPVVGSSGVYATTTEPLIDYPTLVVGRKGTAGKVWLIETPSWPSDTAYFLDWKPGAPDLHFLFFAMIANPLSGEHARTTLPSLPKPDLESFEIALPPMPEQRVIAAALRAVQEARDARRRELATERERKAALMEDLFTNGMSGESLKDSKIGLLPQSWSVVTLGAVAAVSSGGTPDRQNPSYWNGSVPWVKTGEIDYGVIMDTEEKITDLGLKNSSARIVPAGTLLMAMYGQGITRGKVAILGIDASINQACAALRFDSKKVVTRFAFYHLARSYEALRNLGHGANQKNLNASHIRSFPIPLASLEEQTEIADALTACDNKIEALAAEAALIDELFRAMLDELLSSRLSSVPLIERDAVGAA